MADRVREEICRSRSRMVPSTSSAISRKRLFICTPQEEQTGSVIPFRPRCMTPTAGFSMFRFTPRRALWTIVVPIVVTLLILALRDRAADTSLKLDM